MLSLSLSLSLSLTGKPVAPAAARKKARTKRPPPPSTVVLVDHPSMSVEGPLIAMQRSPSLSIDPAPHLTSEPLARPAQLMAVASKRERATSLGDAMTMAAQPMSAQLPRRAKPPLAAQVSMCYLCM